MDLSCIQKLIENFIPVKTLGVGVYGFTFLMKDKFKEDTEIVLKVQNTDENSYAEIVNGLVIINNLNIGIFTKILNWNICVEFPDAWEPFLSEKAEDLFNSFRFHPPYSYITYEKNELSVNDAVLNRDQVMCLIFILLHGTMTAKKTYPYYNHSDIHSGNLMLNRRDPTIPIVLDNGKFVIRNLPYYPKLIDYGLARFSKPNDQIKYVAETNFFEVDGFKYPPTNDVYRIFHVFHMKYPKIIPKSRLQTVFEIVHNDRFFTSNWRDILEFLESKYFNNVNIERYTGSEPSFKKIRTTNALCNSCYSQNVKWTFHNTRDSYFFCSKECGEKFEHIRKILPLK